MTKGKFRSGYLYVLGAGALWGTTGTFAKLLYSQQISSLKVALFRAWIAFIILSMLLLIVRRDQFRIALKDLPQLASLGLVGVGTFSSLYFYTIEVTTITQAVFLVYLAPVFTTFIAWGFLKEPLAATKVVALICSLGGLFLFTGLYNPASLKMPVLGLATGLGAALSYAIMSVVGKVTLSKYSHWTTLLYTIGFGAIFLTFLGMKEPSPFTLSFRNLALVSTMAVVSTLGAFALFYRGLSRVEASRASIVTTIEPLVASTLGFAIFGEMMGITGFAGAALVLAGAVLVQL